jgi:hypothetical protein
MAQTISEYTSQIFLPSYRQTNYDNTLELSLIGKKQKEYDSMVQRLGNLKSQALNISMLNMKGKEKLDGYNRELAELTSQDLGDLTDAAVQSKVAGFFTKIATDSDLKQRSSLSNYYQQQNSLIDNAKRQKDQVKSGYNSINEIVYRKWEGGLEDFMMADDVTNWSQKQIGYTPSKDIDQKLVNMTKLLHEESLLTQGPVKGSPGYDMTNSVNTVSAARIRGLLSSTLDADELAQFDILSKYHIIQQNSPEGKMNLYNQYTGWLEKENNTTKQQLAEATAYKNAYDPAKLDSKLPPDELAKLQAEYAVKREQYTQREQELTQAMAKNTVNQMTPEQWNKLDNKGMLPYINQLTIEKYVNGVSDALEWKKTVQKAGMDEAYFAGQRIDIMREKMNQDERFKQADIRLAEMKMAIDADKDKDGNSKTPTYSDPSDIFKSTQTITESWQQTVDLNNQFRQKTDAIITGVTDENAKQALNTDLTNPKWIKDHADNYEVSLWANYKAMNPNDAIVNDKPNIEGFKAFKAQVENGDFRNNPALSNLQSKYKNESQVSQWLQKTTKEVADLVLATSKIDQTKIGNGPSLGDYAKQNGWDGKGEMTFGLPDGKGGYQRYSWTDLKKEYEKSITPGPITGGVGGAAIRTGTFTILDKDQYFKSLVVAAVNTEKGYSKLIEQIYQDKMPQILQGKQVIGTNKAAITENIGQINESLKYASDKMNIGLTPDDIKQVTVPSGIGTNGSIMLTKSGAEAIKTIGDKITLLDAQGKQVKGNEVVENVLYQFKTNPKIPYDALFNEMFKKEGKIERSIAGSNVIISAVETDPNYYIISIDGKQQSVQARDINLMLREIELGIKQAKGLPATTTTSTQEIDLNKHNHTTTFPVDAKGNRI